MPQLNNSDATLFGDLHTVRIPLATCYKMRLFKVPTFFQLLVNHLFQKRLKAVKDRQFSQVPSKLFFEREKLEIEETHLPGKKMHCCWIFLLLYSRLESCERQQQKCKKRCNFGCKIWGWMEIPIQTSRVVENHRKSRIQHFGTLSLRSNRVTKQVNFRKTQIDGKCQIQKF